MTGNIFKKQRLEHKIPRRKMAEEMRISEARTQQIEAATRLTSRMSERYASAIEAILRRRHENLLLVRDGRDESGAQT